MKSVFAPLVLSLISLNSQAQPQPTNSIFRCAPKFSSSNSSYDVEVLAGAPQHIAVIRHSGLAAADDFQQLYVVSPGESGWGSGAEGENFSLKINHANNSAILNVVFDGQLIQLGLKCTFMQSADPGVSMSN